MGDSYVEWESPTEEAEENMGNMNWLLDKGFTLGRRVLIAGFLISSVPIVLPPLVVMSAVGLACSVPYGFLFAGYVCTEKIMSQLLPGSAPSSHPSPENTAKDGDEEDEPFTENQPVERVKMELDWTEKGRDGLTISNDYGIMEDEGQSEHRDEGHPMEENVTKNDGSGELKKEESSMERKDASMDGVSGVIISIEGDTTGGSNVKEEEVPFEVTGVAVEVCGIGNENDEELVIETRNLIKNIRNEGKVENPVDKTEQTVVENYGEIVKEARELIEKVETQLEKTEQEVVENGGKGSSLARKVATGNESGLLDEKNATAQKYSDEGRGERPKKHEETADDFKANVSAAVSKPENRGTSFNKDPDLPSEKILYSEEKMWKQIDALRAIVGYTAAVQATCVDELKALYIFTGVQPPTASFKDPSDLAEANDELQSLMTIVGVK